MIFKVLLVTHIAVLGYWLGSELVINSTYRYVSWAMNMPFRERDRLMSHVLDVDQHVRYALILQAGLGTALAALLGYLPGGDALAIGAGIATIAWLILVELTHRMRGVSAGRTLSRIDLPLRYIAILVLLSLSVSAWAGAFALPVWLAWKLALFAGVIACGLGIRIQLLHFYKVWGLINQEGSSDAYELSIRQIYVKATAVLIALWICIAGIVVLSVMKASLVS